MHLSGSVHIVASVTGYLLLKKLSYISALIAGLESRGLTEPVDNHPCETSKIAIV